MMAKKWPCLRSTQLASGLKQGQLFYDDDDCNNDGDDTYKPRSSGLVGTAAE